MHNQGANGPDPRPGRSPGKALRVASRTMTTIVETCWGLREIGDRRYWHIVDPGSFFKNNVRVGKGALLSVSAGIAAEPHLHNAHTLYSLARSGEDKEALFEKVRLERYPHRPSRLKTLYVLDEYSLVTRALAQWFPNESKEVYECRLLLGSVTHKADTLWLDAPQETWLSSAEKYWEGVMTETPFPEVLVHGALYFPGWKAFSDA